MAAMAAAMTLVIGPAVTWAQETETSGPSLKRHSGSDLHSRRLQLLQPGAAVGRY